MLLNNKKLFELTYLILQLKINFYNFFIEFNLTAFHSEITS